MQQTIEFILLILGGVFVTGAIIAGSLVLTFFGSLRIIAAFRDHT